MYLLGIKIKNIFSGDRDRKGDKNAGQTGFVWKRNGKDLRTAKGCWLLSHQFPKVMGVNNQTSITDALLLEAVLTSVRALSLCNPKNRGLVIDITIW